MNGPIEVYADWSEDEPAKRLGILRVRPGHERAIRFHLR